MRRPAPALRAALLAVAGLLALVPLACGPPDVPNLDSPGTAVVAFGDSITAGVGAAREESYPARLEERLGIEVVNAGVSGDTTAEGLGRVGRVLARDPWLVIVEFGGNDLLRRRPAEAAERDLAAIVERILDAGAAVVLVELDAPLFGGGYERVYARVADRYGVPLVDDVLGDILSDPGRKSDQIHPNARGYADLAAEVADTVEPLVERRRRLGLPVSP